VTSPALDRTDDPSRDLWPPVYGDHGSLNVLGIENLLEFVHNLDRTGCCARGSCFSRRMFVAGLGLTS
jgi:hypothetical protein